MQGDYKIIQFVFLDLDNNKEDMFFQLDLLK